MRKFKDKAQFDRWWARLQALENTPRKLLGQRKIMLHTTGNPTRDPSRNRPAQRFASLSPELRPIAERHLRTLLTRHIAKLHARYALSASKGNFYWGKLIGCATTMAKVEAGLLMPYRLLAWKTRPAKALKRHLRVNLGLEEPYGIPRGFYLAQKAKGLTWREVYHKYRKGDYDEQLLALQRHETHGQVPPAIVSSTNLEGI